MGQCKFAFALKVLEGADRIVQVSKNSPFYLRLHATTHQKKAGAGQSSGYQQHGKQKLCPHPKFRHALLSLFAWFESSVPLSAYEFVAHAVDRPEMHGIG